MARFADSAGFSSVTTSPSFKPAGHDDVVVVLLAEFDLTGDEGLAHLLKYRRLAVFGEAGAGRNQQRIRFALDDDFGGGAHTRTQTFVQFGDGGARGECLFRGGPAFENQCRDRADPIQLGGEFLIRDGVHANADFLSQPQLAAVHLFQLEVDVHFGKVGDFGDLRAGPGVVAFFEGRRRLAERTLRAEVRQHVDDAVVRRAKLHHAQIALRRIEVADGLVLALIEAAQVGLLAHLVGVDRGLHGLQRAFGHAYLNAVLFAFDGRKHFRLAGVELGTLQIVLARHFAHRVGFVVDLLRRLRLHDVAIGSAHGGRAADDVLVLLRAVELHDDIALLHGTAGLGQVDDAQTGDLRRFQDDRTGALDIAACAHADDEFSTPHASHGNFDFRGSGVAVGRDGAAAAQGERDRPGDDLDSPRVRFTQPLAGSLILRWHCSFPVAKLPATWGAEAPLRRLSEVRSGWRPW